MGQTEVAHEAPWASDIVQWGDIGKDSAGMMLTLAEKRLSESVASAAIISTRADRLLSIQIPLLTVAIGYILSKSALHLENDYLATVAYVALWPLSMSLWFVARNFLPYKISVPGEDPKRMATSYQFDNDLQPEEKYINLVLNQLSSYQLRIERNRALNARRMKNNTWALYALMSLPISPVVAFALFECAQLL